MNIKPVGIKVYQNTIKSARDTKKVSEKILSKNADTITISSKAVEKKEIRALSCCIAREISEGASKERIAMLKEQYQKGDYKPDEKLLTQSLFNDFRI